MNVPTVYPPRDDRPRGEPRRCRPPRRGCSPGTGARQRGRSVESKTIGAKLGDPAVDYAELARSFGLYGEGPLEDPDDLRPALERAIRIVKESKQPALIDVVTQSR